MNKPTPTGAAQSIDSSRFLPAGIVLLALPFARPLLTSGFPDTGDALLNLYRTLALDFAIRHGDFWPRYLVAMHFGFGSPSFNYYGALSFYPLDALHLLAGLSFADAYLIGVCFYAILAALGAYVLGRAWAGPVAGLIAGVGYLYAPPLFDSYRLPGQLLAAALFPWMLWSFGRLALFRQRRDFLLATLLLAAIVLSHSITGFYVAAILLAYVILLVWLSGDRARTLGLLLLPILLAVGLTAFFWLPARAESDYVQLERLNIPQFDYHNHFLPLRQLLAAPLDQAGGVRPPDPQSLGWPQLALSLVGLGLVLIGSRSVPGAEPRRLRRWAAFCALVVVGATFMATSASVWIWETVPMIALILFPQRLLFAAGLFLALLAGLGATFVAQRIRGAAGRVVWIGGCVAAMIVYLLPSLHAPIRDEPPTTSILDLHDLERQTGWYGMTSAKEFLPHWVREEPHAWRLTDRLSQNDLIPRLEPNERIDVEAERWGMHAADLTFQASEPTTLVFEWFYFPGWQAWLDGQPTQIAPTDPGGLIGVPVPAGEHQVRLAFGPTPVRRAATYTSLAFLLSFAALAAFAPWRARSARQPLIAGRAD